MVADPREPWQVVGCVVMAISSGPIAIVVVSYNTVDLLRRCLDSLRPQLAPGDEIVVVDNESLDGSADMVEHEFPSVRLVRSGGNLGFGAGSNLGAAQFPQHDVLLFNPDAVAFPGMLEALHQAQIDLPLAGIIGGRSETSDGRTDPRSCWGAPSPWSAFCFATGLSTAFKESSVFDPESIPGWSRETQREVDVVSGALMLVRRDLWDELDGFDERFFMYGEDLDLCLRGRKAGASPTMYPAAVMRHDVGASSSGTGKLRLLLKGKISAARLHHGRVGGRFMQGCYIAGTGMRAGVAALLRRQTLWRAVWHERSDWRDGYDVV